MSPTSFDRRLYEKYDVAGPRYTSYPTAPHFHAGFGEAAYRRLAAASNEDPIPRPLSLYVHIPFCHSLCYYCACNKVITRHTGKAEVYLHYLERELALQAGLFDSDRPLRQLHLGGGTPTYFDDRQLWRLMQAVGKLFSVPDPDEREYSIEIDPRSLGENTVGLLAELGFNRMSIGVQDFDPIVQQAVNRLQSLEQTWDVIQDARQHDFGSISLDLIYGLPKQTMRGFDTTLDSVLGMRPDRLSLYSYAHLPERVKAQRLIREQDLPSPEEKLGILQLAIERLSDAGYRYIGMDHFALPGSELSQALDNDTLHRNFQGYSTHAECDLVGVGVSAIGQIGHSYSQNAPVLADYYAVMDQGRLPVARGYQLSFDDRLRRVLIQQIMCRQRVDFHAIERTFDVDIPTYFAAELVALEGLAEDGLVRCDGAALTILPPGRLLLRNIAMVFDRYLREQTAPVRYSRTI
ncbi:MAG: oxygen-independent coproporphyrinogen III oxidase [Ectothiorhodospiraceae bacterium]|nr:oxygen-independent coproporphyrinogen III oxidase [Ectothiorhodospiraceae bacterium]MCH8505105.1 oxygen-independent coproporphyrinogen III oxidase [Ectothiorhodospiraceae bacterium]